MWLKIGSPVARVALLAVVVNLGAVLVLDLERERFSALAPSAERSVQVQRWGRVGRWYSPAMALYVRASLWAHFGLLGLAIAAEAVHRARRRRVPRRE